MPATLTLSAPEPLVVPAAKEKTYPNLWIQHLQAHFPDCNGGGRVMVQLRPYRTDEKTGKNEFAPAGSGGRDHLLLDDVLGKAAERSKLTKALALLAEAVQEELQAQERGK